MSKKTKFDAYEAINALIIEGLDRGVGPWSKPWTSNGHGFALPFNPVTKAGGRAYTGANPWMLAIRSAVEGWTDPRFCTAKQAFSKGYTIKKDQTKKAGGRGAAMVFFWKFLKLREKCEKTGQPIGPVKTIPMIKVYSVWNYQQLEGVEAVEIPEPKVDAPIGFTEAERLCDRWSVDTGHGGSRAYYNPEADNIMMPARADFKTEEDYWATRFHEMAHSTGHKSRLNRDFSGRFGNEAYAFEELIAEVTAANLCTASGVTPSGEIREDHIAYIQGWKKAIRKDKNTIHSAFKQARLAAELILESAADAEVEKAA